MSDIKLTINIKEFERALESEKIPNEEYPLTIRCLNDNEHGTWKKGDIFVAKKTFSGDEERFDTKPVMFFSKWMHCDDAEIISDIREII